MRKKAFYKSKTFWVNLLALAAVFGQDVLGFNLTAETQASILVLINMILRMATKGPIEWKSGDKIKPKGSGMFILMAVLPGMLMVQGCSAAMWSKSGTVLGQCLSQCGVVAADHLVTEWVGGEGVDAEAIGWSSLPCVIGCAGKAGAVLVAQGASARRYSPLTDSFESPSPGEMIERAERGKRTPLEMACGYKGNGPPRCALMIFEE